MKINKTIMYWMTFILIMAFVIGTGYEYIQYTDKHHDEALLSWCKDNGHLSITNDCLDDFGKESLSEEVNKQSIADMDLVLNWVNENPEHWKAFKYNTKQLYKDLVKYRCEESPEEITDMGCLSVEDSGKQCVFDLDTATKKNWSCVNSVWELV